MKPNQFVEERWCLSLDPRKREYEEVQRAEVVITFASHLHDRSSCLIKAVVHNTAVKERERKRG